MVNSVFLFKHTLLDAKRLGMMSTSRAIIYCPTCLARTFIAKEQLNNIIWQHKVKWLEINLENSQIQSVFALHGVFCYIVALTTSASVSQSYDKGRNIFLSFLSDRIEIGRESWQMCSQEVITSLSKTPFRQPHTND